MPATGQAEQKIAQQKEKDSCLFSGNCSSSSRLGCHWHLCVCVCLRADRCMALLAQEFADDAREVEDFMTDARNLTHGRVRLDFMEGVFSFLLSAFCKLISRGWLDSHQQQVADSAILLQLGFRQSVLCDKAVCLLFLQEAREAAEDEESTAVGAEATDAQGSSANPSASSEAQGAAAQR